MELAKRSGFIAGLEHYGQASLVVLGAPMDATTSFRPGARFGPARVREVSEGLEEYSHILEKELVNAGFYDAGDIELPQGNVQRSLQFIGQAVGGVFDDARFPLLIGGEHLVSLPAIQAAFRRYPELVVLHFDAHCDLREEYLGESSSHATVMRHVVELVGGQNVYQFGMRSGTREEFVFAKTTTNFYPEEVLEPLAKVLPVIGHRPLYCSIDIDVMDPAFVPGTGTPEPGGIDSKEMMQVIYALKEKNVIGMDIVEFAPVLDHSDVTALLVAKLVRESILAFGKGVVV